MKQVFTNSVQETLILPFGLHFRQLLQPSSSTQKTKQTTSDPEITTGDGADPDKIDAIWISDEEEDEEKEEEEDN